MIIAHSLGNILTSSMIQDHGLSIGMYMMLNAAVPVESYQGEIADTSERRKMVHEDWKSSDKTQLAYAERAFAAKWYKLFEGTNDPRGHIRWQDRFAQVSSSTRCINLYSSQEEVLRSNLDALLGEMPQLTKWLPLDPRAPDIISDREFIWVRQEMQKGKLHWLSNLFGFTDALDDHAGWGSPGGGREHPSLQESIDLDDPQLVANPYFQQFNDTDSKPAGMWVNVSNWIYKPAGADIAQHLIAPPFAPDTPDTMIFRHAKLLAEAIPALSVPAGGHPVDWKKRDPNSDDTSIDLSSDPSISDVINRWPAGYGGRDEKANRWLHGDYKDVAYLYVKGLYDKILVEGGLR
ncbi:MAG: hypothetical protein U1G05_07660 [Kiritimatiellia bacterium]